MAIPPRPSYDELVAEAGMLRSQLEAERAARLAAEAQVAELRAALDEVLVQVADLKRQLGKDSSNSSRPPSSDNPYRKAKQEGRSGRSLREDAGRRPGKQRGAPGSTLTFTDSPDDTVALWPGECCGYELGPADVTSCRRAQVVDAVPPPPPTTIEYRAMTCTCPRCGTVHAAQFPPGVTGRAGYGLEVRARGALLLFVHYLPIRRAVSVLATLTGVAVSSGFMASLRPAAARLLEPFMKRVRDLLRTAGVLHVDETPANTGSGKLSYVHVACTQWLTHLHVGDRSKDAIDAGGVLPGYRGVIVRDGYAGYEHLTDAMHAWCNAHTLRDLHGVYDFDPDRQAWAADMAQVLADGHQAAAKARAAGQTRLDEPVLAGLRGRYQAAWAQGLAGNAYRAGKTAEDARRLCRRFRDNQHLILAFVFRTDIPFTNNQAETDCRGVKVQQRTSGGCWRTLTGLADFAIVHSYVSTCRKWGIDQLEALRRLFAGDPWLPPDAQPP